MQIQNFLSDFPSFRTHCDSLTYAGIVSPADGVLYPGISLDIPEAIQTEIAYKLAVKERAPVRVHLMFLRLSLEGVDAPHQAHTDTIMGKRSMMLYLNHPEDCYGGTALVCHESGMNTDPQNEEELALWTADTNNPSKWHIQSLCRMETNKAFLFDANRMHRAEPVGGFGTDATNGRLVLTAFYSLLEVE